MFTADEQYLELINNVLSNGKWVFNERTGKRVLTIINADMEYDCRDHTLPVLTTKKTYYRSAIAEMLGYLRGYTNAADFSNLGTKTWLANANAKTWQNSIYCAGENDMGYCYGAVARKFKKIGGGYYDQVGKVYRDLKEGIDDRGEIITFMHPGTEHMACLRACMHTHTFSILDNTLYLTSYQRSADVPLGVPFNMIQVAWLLMTMAQITGLRPGIAYHKMVNVHIYEDQIDGMHEQINREPMEHPKLIIDSKIQSFDDLMKGSTTTRDFAVTPYKSHEAIVFPFSE